MGDDIFTVSFEGYRAAKDYFEILYKDDMGRCCIIKIIDGKILK